MIDGNLEVKLPTIWTDEKERWEESEKRRGEEKKRREEERRSEKRRSQKKEDAGAGKSRKVAIHCVFFQWFVAPEGLKGGSLKRRVRSHLAGWEKKWNAVVAQSKFPSQNVQSPPTSDHFWKLRCRKSARRCGAKHMSKSKSTKLSEHFGSWDVKKCTPLWREAHFQVKMYKAHQRRTSFGSWHVEKMHTVVVWSTFRSQSVQSTPFSEHFGNLRCQTSACRCGAKHISKSSKSKRTKQTILGPLLEVAMSKKCTQLWREAHFRFKM